MAKFVLKNLMIAEVSTDVNLEIDMSQAHYTQTIFLASYSLA